MNTVFSSLEFPHPIEETIQVFIHKKKPNAETIRDFQGFNEFKQE